MKKTTTSQHLADNEDERPLMVGNKEVVKLLGISRTTWNNLIASGNTPKPSHLGRRVLWLKSEIESWCRAGCPSREKWENLRSQS